MLQIGPLELDQAQFQAASCKGRALVIAGPGAGKSRTLLARALYLLDSGVPPENIFLLTFTVKTARELKERIKSLKAPEIKVDTFHGLAFDLCRLQGKSPRLLNQKEQESLFKEILRRRGKPLRGARKLLETLLAGQRDDEGLLSAYEKALEEEGLWDFRRLLKEAGKENPLQEKKIHLLVDEFQDLNSELLSFLRSFKRACFYFVGDPAQAIYGFRGARPELVKDFIEAEGDFSIFFLPRSYRVPGRILSLAATLLESPFEIPPLEAVKEGGEVEVSSFRDPEKEARGIASQIEDLLGGLQMESSRRGLAPSQIAVAARLRRLLGPVREALKERGIPVEEPAPFPEEVAEKVQRALLEAKDLLSFKNVLGKEILSLPEVSFLLETSRDLSDFSVRWNLFKLQQTINLRKTGVALLTIHETKGLEFKAVFLTGAEKGLLPLEIFEDTDPQEEKRLAYVALTRAEEIFRASFCQKRSLFGQKLPGKISPLFINFPRKESLRTKPRPRQKRLF